MQRFLTSLMQIHYGEFGVRRPSPSPRNGPRAIALAA